MNIELKLQMNTQQRLVMTPMLQQAIKLLIMTRLELVQAIRTEVQDNPLLDEIETGMEEEEDTATLQAEEIDTSTKEREEEKVFEEQSTLKTKEEPTKDEIEWDAYMQSGLYEGATGVAPPELPSIENTLKQKEDLEGHLSWQLKCSAMDEREKELGEVIIGNINSEGYLEETLEELASQASATLDEMEDAITLVHSFDPPGIGARNLKECLLLQVRANGMKNSLVESLFMNHLEFIDERNFKKLAKLLDTSLDEIIMAAKTIREFDPKPGLEFSNDETHYITPDLHLIKIGEEYQVFLNDDDTPRLRINPYYQSILKNKKSEKKDTRDYLENKFRSAIWVIKSIEQRRQTILKVGRSICHFQKEFLDKGVNYLKPLILKDVADDIGMHESTVSRVTTNKYIHTPQGLYELKFFFHSAVGSYFGSDMSSVRVKEMIRVICKEEDPANPYTDDEIVIKLQSTNVKIARRTVTKYRTKLAIPSTSKRKRLFY